MSEKNPKFEKIVKGIEKTPFLGNARQEGVLSFSIQEQAEQLWAFWNDYRQKKYGILTKAREERKGLKKAEESPELIKLKERISNLWQNPVVQVLFKKHLAENIEEREEFNPDLRAYHQKEKELRGTSKQYEDLLKNLFVHRGEEPDELTQIDLAELSARIDILKASLKETFHENPELASFIQYEKIKEYHRQFEKTSYIWSPSREELFEKILKHLVLLDKNRPMLLTGETGTGKTRLVRAAVERITSKPAFEVGEEAKSDIRPLLGSASIEKNKTFISYGPLGQALTGKKNSLDEKSDGGGIFYMDEMNGYPPDALRSLIKQISGRSPGEKITFAAWRGQWEEVAEKSGLIGAANLPSEKHPDRLELPVEIIRELVSLEVDYPEQTAENSELYEMMLASLMDKNGRIRLEEGELEPDWKEVVDPKTKEKTKDLNLDSKAGGTLWRFANLIYEIQKSYKGQENVLTPTKGDASYLYKAVLDPGMVLSWLREYRVSILRKNIALREFLQEKLSDLTKQKTYSLEDRNLLKEFFAAYNLPIDGSDVDKSDIKGEKIWSEKEIGFLSPRVPRLKEKAGAPKPIFRIAFLEDGTEIEYQPVETAEEIKNQDKIITFIGQTVDGKVVLENKSTKIAEMLEKMQFEKLRKENYLQRLKSELESLKSDDLERKLAQIADNLATKSEELREFNKLKPQGKINFILELIDKNF